MSGSAPQADVPPAGAPRTFTAVVNPTAGGSASARTLIPLARLLREAGATVQVEYSRGLEHAAALARGAAGAGHVVLGVGGDGMVGCVGGALAGSGAVLGIVPAGRGNDFARQLRLPSGPEELAELLLHGEPRPVDAIDANGVPVLGSVYAGVDALANQYANETRFLRGALSYTAGALRAVAGWKAADYIVTVDGVEHRRSGFTVVVANSGYYGFDRRIAPQAVEDDGLLDVVIVTDGPKRLFFGVMRDLADGAHLRRPQVETLRGREVRIELAAPGRTLPYGADGELPGVLPVTAKVIPGALRVLAPRASAGRSASSAP
ncbi:diacylglycerol/lipid kinase family protein [Actinomadura parmotrematis]|uniref:Diacylglycerol kinase family lipid kinase n=1 Tax=Actinomadura parmotrematis TaxID=2864039 RepID=A0ABS7FRX0_9ACTN|nr:diacylglycerol kinase family protein [Actinomadura parmotrematis]MBW8482469.1 diacylglycerol kinase family lipid kinase [Actinomadura parmotrematis]